MISGHILVDLDGVLAHESPKWLGIEHIGHPIPVMVRRVKRWLKAGLDVRCFTARIHNDPVAAHHVEQWLKKQGLGKMILTCVKSQSTLEYWDDRAVCVERNTGRILGRNKTRALPCHKHD